MLFQLKGKSNFLGRLQEELAQSTNIPQGLQVTYNLIIRSDLNTILTIR